MQKVMQRRRFMEKLRLITVAASALALGGMLAIGTAQAGVPGGPDAMRAASQNGSLMQPVQFRFGGRDYCWYDDGWKGAGWYWCGYALRPGFGWGGPIGWNNWRRVEHREDIRDHRDFRDHDDRRDFHDHDRR
jgi:hypothetical protein